MANLICPDCKGNIKKIPNDYALSAQIPGRKPIVLKDILYNHCTICQFKELALESYELVHTMETFHQEQNALNALEEKNNFGLRIRRG